MSSIEDRVRAATRARADLVRDVRPLEFPGELPARARQFRLARRWGGWLIPLSSAVAVIVIAAILVAVRGFPGIDHASGRPVPAGHGSVAGLPRYGVVLTKTAVTSPAGPGAVGGFEIANLSVFDTQTGKQVTLVEHPAKEDIQVFYLLRIDPGSETYKLTRLNIPAQPSASFVDGFALSPDGRTLAVLEWDNQPEPWDHGSPATLRLCSVATGKALRTWTGDWRRTRSRAMATPSKSARTTPG